MPERFWETEKAAVELYLKAGLAGVCCRGCPVDWYENDCTN